MKNIIDSTKKRARLTAICGALLLAMTTSTMFTVNASGTNVDNTLPETSEAGVQTETNSTFTRGSRRIMTKTENGVTLYSTDDGETWSEEKPENSFFSISEIDKDAIKERVAKSFENGELKIGSVTIKREEGVTLYSTDGGETWSEEVPEGIIGGFTHRAPFMMSNIIDIMEKEENGVTLYSTDGGETWSEEMPENFTPFEMSREAIRKSMPTFNFSIDEMPEEFGLGTSIAVKIENGVTLYSTDGGETWSEEMPEGMEVFTRGTSFKTGGSKTNTQGETTKPTFDSVEFDI